MLLSQELEALDEDDADFKEKLNIISLKYDNLIQDCAFEEIPQKTKTNVSKLFSDANRFLPIQLNGTTGNNIVRRNTPPKVLSKGASLVTVDNTELNNIKDLEVGQNV